MTNRTTTQKIATFVAVAMVIGCPLFKDATLLVASFYLLLADVMFVWSIAPGEPKKHNTPIITEEKQYQNFGKALQQAQELLAALRTKDKTDNHVPVLSRPCDLELHNMQFNGNQTDASIRTNDGIEDTKKFKHILHSYSRCVKPRYKQKGRGSPKLGEVLLDHYQQWLIDEQMRDPEYMYYMWEEENSFPDTYEGVKRLSYYDVGKIIASYQ